jgi:hypothetical protein
LTDEQLADFKPVGADFLRFGYLLSRTLRNGHRDALTGQLSYFNALREKQRGAWKRKLEKWQEETAEINRRVADFKMEEL